MTSQSIRARGSLDKIIKLAVPGNLIWTMGLTRSDNHHSRPRILEYYPGLGCNVDSPASPSPRLLSAFDRPYNMVVKRTAQPHVLSIALSKRIKSDLRMRTAILVVGKSWRSIQAGASEPTVCCHSCVSYWSFRYISGPVTSST